MLVNRVREVWTTLMGEMVYEGWGGVDQQVTYARSMGNLEQSRIHNSMIRTSMTATGVAEVQT